MAHRTAWVTVAVTLAGVPAGSELAPRVEGELALRSAVARQDVTELMRLFDDPQTPDPVRGRALIAWLGDGEPLEGRQRALLVETFADPAPEVRLAAVRVVGARKEKALEREVLKRAAEDPNPRVRVQSVRVLRDWTRQGHLYFLDRALRVPWPEVREEVLVNLSRVPYRELPPELVDQVRALAEGSTVDSRVRAGALTVLTSWGLADWDQLRDIISDPALVEPLRLHALQLSDTLSATPERDDLLLDLIRGGTSLRVAWEAFTRLARGPRNSTLGVSEAVADYLVQHGETNSATRSMAEFLVGRGYQVRYRAGWQALRP